MLFIRDTATIPNPGWVYPGLNGHTVMTRNYGMLYEEIVKHYTSNGQPPPSQDEVIAYLCANLSIPCIEGNTPLINRWTLGLPSPSKAGCCGKKEKAA